MQVILKNKQKKRDNPFCKIYLAQRCCGTRKSRNSSTQSWGVEHYQMKLNNDIFMYLWIWAWNCEPKSWLSQTLGSCPGRHDVSSCTPSVLCCKPWRSLLNFSTPAGQILLHDIFLMAWLKSILGRVLTILSPPGIICKKHCLPIYFHNWV